MPVMTDVTQRFPPELLVEILSNASIPDVLRTMQVNRIFRDVIKTSPLLQHKIELFAAGFEYNAAAGIGVSDSREAFHQYLENLHSLCPPEGRFMGELPPLSVGSRSNGVLGIDGDSLQLTVPGSTLRRTPWRKWEIPLPVTGLRNCDFYPNADVLAVVELPREPSNLGIPIHLRTFSDGSHHPAARSSTIYYSLRGARSWVTAFGILITSSRLKLFMVGVELSCTLVIWDWKSGQMLYELDGEHYTGLEFIDDHRLLALLEPSPIAPPSLIIINTREATGGAPVKTFFRLPPPFSGSHIFFSLERGVHRPPPAEAMAPFRQDPAQRIVVLRTGQRHYYLALRIGTLLEFIESHEGLVINWGDWKRYTLVLPVNGPKLKFCWVSGCRFFVVNRNEVGPYLWEMEAYDFSARGRVVYLSGRVNNDLGGVRYISSTGARRGIPYDTLRGAYLGHDGIVFRQSLVNEPTSIAPELLHVWTVLTVPQIRYSSIVPTM